ncbi:MAG TPA: hypothetical protein VF852_04815 [Pseudolabrys sp.]
MDARTHLKLFVIATVAWALFWVIGLPAYYQQYSTPFMVWFDALALLPLGLIFLLVLRRVRPGRRMQRSLWMAFYFTVPVAIYDWLYCGLFLGYGLSFVLVYWYLSVYYVLPWLVLPVCAAFLNRRQMSQPV